MDVDVVVVGSVLKCGGGGAQKVSTCFMGVQSFLLSVIPMLIVFRVSVRDFVVGVLIPVVVVFVLTVSDFLLEPVNAHLTI